MRIVFFIAMVCGVVSCTTLPLKQSEIQSAPKEGLSKQVLAAGECGMFLWSLSSPPVFMFFQQNNIREARVFLKQEIVMRASSPIFILPQSSNFIFEYLTDTGQAITVKGQYGNEMQGGRRILSGSIVMENSDGWQEITPVSGVYACR